MSKGLCIITGASRGIGAATALRAARDGWDIGVNYVGNEAAARDVAARVEAEGRRAVVIQGDTSREADIVRLFDEAEAALGPVRGLVNNAGITGKISRVQDMSAAAIAEVMNLNVVGLILCCREAARRMSVKAGHQGGAVVNLSSIAARLGAPNEFTHYAASKGAVDSFTIGFAREVIGDGVRVNAVAPGMIDTDIHASAGAPDRAARLGPTTPIGRSAAPGEVAEAIVWLLSDAAGYCAGSILEVSGGR